MAERLRLYNFTVQEYVPVVIQLPEALPQVERQVKSVVCSE
jgi:hypothetical protein